MKKVLLSAALLGGMMFGANAQDEAAASNGYKQEAGNKSVELVFNPGAIFGSTGGSQLSLANNGLKLRSFSSETSAMRLGVNLSIDNATNLRQEDNQAGDPVDLKTKTSTFNLWLRPGIEKHFAGTDRISPYVGGEVIIGLKSSSTKVENMDADDKITENKTTGANATDGITFGLGAFAGVDYYFAKKLYVGAEVGYGLTYFSQATQKYTDGADSGNNNDTTNGGTLNFSPSLATGNLRIGWTF